MEIALYKMEEKGPYARKFYRRIGESSVAQLDPIIKFTDGKETKSYYYDQTFSKETGHPSYILQGETSVFLPVDGDSDIAPHAGSEGDVSSPGGNSAGESA